MDHTPSTPARDPKLDFPAANHDPLDVQAIDHGNDMNMGLIATIAAASAMLVFVTITLTQAWFFHVQAKEREAKSYNRVNHELLDLTLTQKDNINAYRWQDSNHKVVAVPIGRAMDLTIERYRKQQAESKAESQ